MTRQAAFSIPSARAAGISPYLFVYPDGGSSRGLLRRGSLVRSTDYFVIELKTGKFQPEFAGNLPRIPGAPGPRLGPRLLIPALPTSRSSKSRGGRCLRGFQRYCRWLQTARPLCRRPLFQYCLRSSYLVVTGEIPTVLPFESAQSRQFLQFSG